jgi:polysaccharide biosynthesis protein PslH
MAKAVVSTSIGAEGLPVRNGEHLIVADTPSSFAEKTLRLLGDPSGCEQLGRRARLLVEQNYSWAKVSDGFTQVLEHVGQKTRDS